MDMFVDESKNDTIVTSLVVGGSKGHIEETIHGPILELYHQYRWKMIPKCTGRYTCRDHKLVSRLPPLQVVSFLGEYWKQYEFVLPKRSDTILVIPLDTTNETGVITYVKIDKDDDEQQLRYVHTLNTPSGFRRKLFSIGIFVDDNIIRLMN